jgi:hypothetical protein
MLDYEIEAHFGRFKEGALKFRDDFRELFQKNYDYSSFNLDKQNLTQNIKNGAFVAKKSYSRLDSVVGLIGLIISVLLNFVSGLGVAFTFFAIFLTFFLFVFPLEITARKALVDILAYKKPTDRMPVEDLIFMEAWNKGVLNNPYCLAGIYAVSRFMKGNKWVNKITLGVLDRVMKIRIRKIKAGKD